MAWFSFVENKCPCIHFTVWRFAQIEALVCWKDGTEFLWRLFVVLKDGRQLTGFLYCLDSLGGMLLVNAEESFTFPDTGKLLTKLRFYSWLCFL